MNHSRCYLSCIDVNGVYISAEANSYLKVPALVVSSSIESASASFGSIAVSGPTVFNQTSVGDLEVSNGHIGDTLTVKGVTTLEAPLLAQSDVYIYGQLYVVDTLKVKAKKKLGQGKPLCLDVHGGICACGQCEE